ncbi:MAG: serine/threonine protein kinase [Myxococcales bacterium]|nr:serine/threonine protein kinase [Myxococcales bacterium]
MSAYVHLFELARGGLGHVSVVMRHDGSYERLFVLKRPFARLVRDPATRATFLDEARLAGLLRHPHVVSVVDVGEDDEGPFLVMDYVECVHVGDLVRGLAGERPPLGVALEVVRQAAEGLHAAHELVALDGTPLGVVHRDVSPQNVLVGFDGAVRITDFGIALAQRRSAGVETTFGLIKGKVGYMSPEQLAGLELDRRSDLFSLGVVLVELLTGARLYHAATHAETAQRIVEEDPPDLGELRRDVPDALVELTFDLLAKRPEDRPASAREVATRLKEIRDDLGEEIELEAFVDDLFAERRQALRARVREAREAKLGRAPTTGAVSIRRASRLWWAGLFSVAIAASGLMWWAARTAPVVDKPPLVGSPAAEPLRSRPLFETERAEGADHASDEAAPFETEHAEGGAADRDDADHASDEAPPFANDAAANDARTPEAVAASAAPDASRGSRDHRRGRPRPRSTVVSSPPGPTAPAEAPPRSVLPPTAWWPRESTR